MQASTSSVRRAGEPPSAMSPFAASPSSSAPNSRLTTAVSSHRPQPVSVDVGRPARRVVVAHRLLEPAGPAGHGIGTAVAEYVFHLANGTSTVSIRERFEIQIVQRRVGTLPVPRGERHPRPQDGPLRGPLGPCRRTARRALPRLAQDFFLWCWENPDPDIALERFELIPRGPPILVAGVTLGTDEHPFVRTPARPVRLMVTDSTAQPRRRARARRRPWRRDVPAAVAARTNASAGRGTPTTGQSCLRLRRGPAVGDRDRPTARRRARPVPWSDVERDGQPATDRVRVELVDPGRNWVHVTVLDDATGKPVPCRVHFRSPAGVPYQPHGHHQHVNQNLGSWHQDVGGDVRLGETTYAYIDGTCQGWLPRGDVLVDVARGFEYEPLRQTVRIEPGQRDLTLRLRRSDMAAHGWYSGDSHVHFLSTAGAQLEQLGEDLRVVNLLQAQWGALFTNTEDYGPAASPARHRRRRLLHLRRPGEPSARPGPPGDVGHEASGDAVVQRWPGRGRARRRARHDAVRLGRSRSRGGRDGGRGTFPEPERRTGRAHRHRPGGRGRDARPVRDGLAEYYRYLNSGYRLPLVGGTDKMSNSVPVGLYRTYAQLDADEELTYEGWCRAVRPGRTFVSGGPLLSFTVDGGEVGDTIELAGPGTVTVDASVTSVFPLRSLEVVCNGEVVAGAEAGGDGKQAS